jgi:hypothetical protein
MTTYTVTIKTIKDNEIHQIVVDADNRHQAEYIAELLLGSQFILINCEVTK